MDLDHLHRGVAALFPVARHPAAMRVAVEQELISRDRSDNSPVPIGRIRHSARRSPYRGFLGFEPGGQVELSFPCCSSVRRLERRYLADLGTLRDDCASIDVAVESVSLDPYRQSVPLQLRLPRYLGMQRHFDRIGPAGRQMMRRTASTQLCLDWWAGSEGVEQWRLAQLSGPALAATFAANPSSRLAIWLAVDPARTAFDHQLLAGSDPVLAYAEFAAAAGTFAMPGDADELSESLPFRDWWRLSAHRSGLAVDHHLSTLFPPVRPRGRYLEFRYLDAQPDGHVAIVASVLATLLYDPETRRAALALLAAPAFDLAEDWQAAAKDPSDPALLDRGRRLLALAMSGMRRASRDYLPADIIGRTGELVDRLERPMHAEVGAT